MRGAVLLRVDVLAVGAGFGVVVDVGIGDLVERRAVADHQQHDIPVGLVDEAMGIARVGGDAAGLTQFGVSLVRLPPACWSSQRHWHAHEDEFIWVVEGEVVLETNQGSQTLRPGMCAGFAAGSGNAHRFVNRTDRDVVLLVIGDRTPFDEITYPDIDNHARMDASGRYVFTRKDGTPHEEP